MQHRPSAKGGRAAGTRLFAGREQAGPGAQPPVSRHVALALGIMYVSTGTTFLAMKLVTEQIAPVQMTALRFLCAALALAPVTFWRLAKGAERPSAQHVRAAAISAFLLLLIGQTALVWGVSKTPAGIAAVIGSASPMFIAIISAVVLREPLPRSQIIGIAVRFAGIFALTSTAPAGEIMPLALAALLLSAAAWATGSLYAAKAALPRDPIVSLNLQLLFGALMVIPLATIDVWYSGTGISDVSLPTWGAFGYLVIVAITSFLAFNWLNSNTSSTVANTFAYVAPVLALALSAIFLGETIAAIKGLAVFLTLSGVALMVR